MLELQALKLPEAEIKLLSGRELRYRFRISPSAFGRVYDCQLQVKPDSQSPEVIVLAPCLQTLAGSATIPHIYSHAGLGTKLCLWWPKRREWKPQMKLAETFIPWTAEWLWYFEDWLFTGKWEGGGAHPPLKRSGLRRTMQRPSN